MITICLKGGIILIKRKIFSLLLLIVLLTACNTKDVNDMIFEGESNNWHGVVELNELNQLEYAGDLILSYKGDDSFNEFAFEILLDDNTKIKSDDISLDENGETVIRISCSNCDYSSDDPKTIITVKWNKQTESFDLK